ncbi:hypothetical protein Trco_001513 [Trichoderma cornu-damae]|uniref:NADP-dependent oxidoreductase domain-containing protein n=1 Tax=Trichoderma cornu-damae TaxID=654480 RepID=A0A9P8QY21_9HYPO|nr:hypothetical protein Trco_001513 [Trichoderma cornu-damae]
MSKSPARLFSLNNGENVPAVGLGTFQGDQGNSKVKDAVAAALKLGYRHIDGASAYGNEREIGEAIKESGIPRHEIFVTSKLAQTWHEPADVRRALELSLKDLQMDYGKSHLNYPVIDYDLSKRYPETWKAMEQLVDLGLARSIGSFRPWPCTADHFLKASKTGLSNFNILKTKRILSMARIIPTVNQVEIHPYLPQHELLEFSSKNGILLMAHQPLGGRPVQAVRGSDEPFPTADSKARVSTKKEISPGQAPNSDYRLSKSLPDTKYHRPR